MLEDFEEHIVPLMGKYPDELTRAQDFTFERFKVAASWVSSRAFGVDSWHGETAPPDDSDSCQQWRQMAGAGEVLGMMTCSAASLCLRLLCCADTTPDAAHVLHMKFPASLSK